MGNAVALRRIATIAKAGPERAPELSREIQCGGHAINTLGSRCASHAARLQECRVPDHTPVNPVDIAAELDEATIELSRTDVRDTEAVLAAMWQCVSGAHQCGLRAAADGQPWRSWQGNAAAVEHSALRSLGSSDAFADHVLTFSPAVEGSTGEPERLVASITSFTEQAERVLTKAASHATGWHDQRACYNLSRLAAELREAWKGNRISYRLVDGEA